MANSAFSAVNTVSGTGNQIVSSGGLNPIISIASNPVLPGTGGTRLPTGTTAERAGAAGTVRFNTTIPAIEGTLDGATWITLASGIGPILSISGTANRITVSAGVNPVVDIAATYVGQTSITTLGTITTGTWSATAITEIHGGTNQTTYALGDTLFSSAANTLSKLAGNITAVKQYLSQTGTGAVSAAPVWATIDGGDITGAALTAVNDTNVTLTAGGTPLTALLRAASITAGWAGQLSLARGGSNANLTANLGGIVYSTATAFAILAGTATATQMLQSGASAAPAWSTSTWPTTTTVNQILYSNATNTVTGLATANRAVLTTTSAGVPVMTALAADGQLIVGSTAGAPAAATLTAGANITITNASNSITIASTGGAAGSLQSFQVFTSGTAQTYTKPANVTNILVECIGGGGGGGGMNVAAGQGSGAGGGGGGGYCRKLITSAAATYTYTVGAAGTAGSSGNNAGGAGGATTFSGSSLSAAGGSAGSGGASSASFGADGGGGAGGAGTNGDVNITGQSGTQGTIGAAAGAGICFGGQGGSSQLGAGAPQTISGTSTSNAGIAAAANSGGGGSGASGCNATANQAGAAGGAGLIIVWEFS